ncbi:hypothetical protein AB1I92_07810 [Bacillus mobilis]|uniref:YqzN/YkzM domain-containing protein n=2 Tax=Bacillus cereus group TaxID=86661 RepID=A0A1Q4L799_BACCE|nr:MULTISPECIES: hypothetical protein [Bacillus cereus group]OKA34378.1 hypothetical protein BJR07_22930 [Bacillus cereus]OKA38147.1 hypothetical protein BJR06_11920 [Bacillus cereus]
MANKEAKQQSTPAPVVQYPVNEIVEQAEQLFHVPKYIAGAALSEFDEVDVDTARNKIEDFLKKEVY